MLYIRQPVPLSIEDLSNNTVPYWTLLISPVHAYAYRVCVIITLHINRAIRPCHPSHPRGINDIYNENL